jgi:SAM-dependent methyltransferase
VTRQGQQRPPTYENLARFWEDEATEIGETPEVTIRDRYFRVHELHTLMAVVPECRRLLDVGCGTGLGTLLLSRRAGYAVGVDFAAPMLRWAQRLRDDDAYRRRILAEFSPLAGWDDGGGGEVHFAEGDVMELDLRSAPFDVITGQRVLINLPSHGDQMTALRQLRAHAGEDALLVLTEATVEGHARTDAFRGRLGLPPLEKYWHNRYVEEASFGQWPDAGWAITANLGWETYALLSKVVYPAACGPERCRFDSAANRAAMEVASTFRSAAAVAEIGLDAVLDLYTRRVTTYDTELGGEIGRWLSTHSGLLAGWDGLGHQRLILARPA